MGSVTARQTLRVPLLWCDASKLGEFVDFLYSLVEPELAAASEYAQTRAVPRWSMSAGPRQITATGSWREVEKDVPWDKARGVTVDVDGPSTSFDLSTGWGTVSLTISAASTGWLDHNIPLIRSRLRSLSPRWTFLVWRPIFVGICAGALTALAGGLTTSNAVTGYTTLGIFAASGIVCLIPTVRLGPQPRPIWLRATLAAVGAITVAAVGAIVGKVMFPG